MKIRIILHAHLRELLPPEAKGRIVLEFPEQTRIAEVIEKMKIPGPVSWAVNDSLSHDPNHILNEDDSLRFFDTISGG